MSGSYLLAKYVNGYNEFGLCLILIGFKEINVISLIKTIFSTHAHTGRGAGHKKNCLDSI